MALTAAMSAWEPRFSTHNDDHDIASAVALARAHISPRNLNVSGTARPVVTPEIAAAFQLIQRRGLSKAVFNDFLGKLGSSIGDTFAIYIGPLPAPIRDTKLLPILTYDDVESNFTLIKDEITHAIAAIETPSSNDDEQDQRVLRVIAHLFERLASWQRTWGVPLRAFQDNGYISAFTRTFHFLLHSTLPPSFPAHLIHFLSTSLSSLPSNSSSPPSPSPPSPSFPSTSFPSSSTQSTYQQNPRPKIPPPTPHLSRLGIFPRYSGSLSHVAHEEIRRIALEEADKGWGERRLGRARQRIGDGVANWLAGMFEGNDSVQASLRPMFSRFDYFLCKCFFDIRTDELFDIIIDFPDSMAALEDLKECLFKVDQRVELVNKLKAANVKRLLHPGAETHLILNIYISTIRSLRILDPPGVLLHSIALPIRAHLLQRPDTIKCIVETLVNGEELQDENEGGLIGEGEAGAEDFADPRWEPEPIDAAPEFRSSKSPDILSTLTSIYPSTASIIEALQAFLANRLLLLTDYDAVQEVRTIELLKLRFGEGALAGCDVMVKDVADSKRIDARVQGEKESVVHPMVLSKMFWPDMPRSSLVLPPKMQKIHTSYEQSYHSLNPAKHLSFLPSHGSLTLTIALSDRTLHLTCTPLQAAMMEFFEKKEVWGVEELSGHLGVGKVEVGRALGWWGEQGVVREEGKGRWRLVEVLDGDE
ncbi:hypothetical protein L202_01813 [Cryptococcus amylolentus CBS 6039]|uniref:Cullin family profile domain-containing protein n=1 Tax=Cryptococcus amylolentus CBS 6039 TaxID=1295533 RepID=A0A1E3I538_9TREE|nr:hypothetical protein L202_01813 [Cryptococcus amylolentus CBS 6039]ODN83719.1 hypothetical protein L202_01813 [Cryptococcus amylolentus CBS 6039]